MEYDNRNKGALFINDRKDKPNHPDYSGRIEVTEPGLYYLKGWKKQTKTGGTMLSLVIELQPEDKQPEYFKTQGGMRAETSAPKQPSEPTSDEIPF